MDKTHTKMSWQLQLVDLESGQWGSSQGNGAGVRAMGLESVLTSTLSLVGSTSVAIIVFKVVAIALSNCNTLGLNETTAHPSHENRNSG